jgi:hypothetical protein
MPSAPAAIAVARRVRRRSEAEPHPPRSSSAFGPVGAERGREVLVEVGVGVGGRLGDELEVHVADRQALALAHGRSDRRSAGRRPGSRRSRRSARARRRCRRPRGAATRAARRRRGSVIASVQPAPEPEGDGVLADLGRSPTIQSAGDRHPHCSGLLPLRTSHPNPGRLSEPEKRPEGRRGSCPEARTVEAVGVRPGLQRRSREAQGRPPGGRPFVVGQRFRPAGPRKLGPLGDVTSVYLTSTEAPASSSSPLSLSASRARRPP